MIKNGAGPSHDFRVKTCRVKRRLIRPKETYIYVSWAHAGVDELPMEFHCALQL